jgi:membrane protein DedA with SNARE-associated domain
LIHKALNSPGKTSHLSFIGKNVYFFLARNFYFYLELLMDAFIQWITHVSPDLIQSLGYIVVFIMTIGEGIPPFGFLLPGQNIVILAGFFARMDQLYLPFVLCFVFVGGWLGDLFAYQFGAKY